MDFTANWGWPQWTIVALILLRFALNSAKHGQPKVETVGPRKGEPELHNGFAALTAAVIWTAVLICGGFFA